jgi:hypothetical protein
MASLSSYPAQEYRNQEEYNESIISEYESEAEYQTRNGMI